MMPVKRSSTEYDAGQVVKALFERSKILTAVVVVSTGPIEMTPLAAHAPMANYLVIAWAETCSTKMASIAWQHIAYM